MLSLAAMTRFGPDRPVTPRRLGAAAALCIMAFAGSMAASGRGSSTAAQQPVSVTASGLALPRFVSLKSDRVNLRKGPSTDYPTLWVYRRAGLPLEVVGEHEGWRQVRDAEGASGWVLQSMLSGRRTALVLPWEIKPEKPLPVVAIRTESRDGGEVIANVEAGTIANVRSCDGRWCHVVIGEFKGYLEQKKLWGVYEGESVR